MNYIGHSNEETNQNTKNLHYSSDSQSPNPQFLAMQKVHLLTRPYTVPPSDAIPIKLRISAQHRRAIHPALTKPSQPQHHGDLRRNRSGEDKGLFVYIAMI